jgi:hypothetical protein
VTMTGGWLYFQEDWTFNQKVTFDGANRLIIVGANVDEIDVKIDIYSDWKEWLTIRDNSKFLPALRVTGGDPVGGGEFTGDVYFLINNWRILVDHSCNINGVIYSDNFPSPFVPVMGTQIVTNKVSALVNTVEIGGSGGGSGISAADVWSFAPRTLTSYPPFPTIPTPPTVVDIRTEIDNNSTQLAAIKAKTDTITSAPTPLEVAEAVRTELTPELAKIMTLENNPGLTPSQATMLLEMYDLLGLDPIKPLVVTKTARTAGAISQVIQTDDNSTTVTRV